MHKSLLTIKNRLNEYLKSTVQVSEDVAVLRAVSTSDATVSNQVVLSLVNVKREVYANSYKQSYISDHKNIITNKAPLNLNLYVLISSNFGDNNYEESLKYLSLTIQYFQANSTWNHQSTPELDKRIDKLSMEIVDMDFHELSQLWSIAGCSYMPSVLYKVRMVTIETDGVDSETRAIDTPNIGINH